MIRPKISKRWELVRVLLATFVLGGILMINSAQAIETETDIITSVGETTVLSYSELLESGDAENILIVQAEELNDTHGAIGVTMGKNQIYFLMYDSAETRDAAKEQLKNSPKVRYAVKNQKVRTLENTSEITGTTYNSWGITATGLDNAIAQTEASKDAAKITAAVIDTGLDVELFRQNFPNRTLYTVDVGRLKLECNTARECNWTEDSIREATDQSIMGDENGHGTHTIGTITEGTPDNVAIMAIRFSYTYRAVDTEFTDAIYGIWFAHDWGADKGLKVISMSLGWEDDEIDEDDMEFYESQFSPDVLGDIIVVAATGNNSGMTPICYPAAFPNTIAIGAIDKNKEWANFSNYGPEIDYVMPGVDIVSLNGSQDGTSMATPHAAAAVAILKSWNPDLTLTEVRSLLTSQAEDLGTPGWDEYYGYGMINFTSTTFCKGKVICEKSDDANDAGMVAPNAGFKITEGGNATMATTVLPGMLASVTGVAVFAYRQRKEISK